MAGATDYKRLIRQSSIILFIVIALYLALVRPLTQQGVNILQGQIDEAVSKLKKYIPREQDELLPTEENLEALEKALKQNQKNYALLKEFIDPDKEYLPPGTQEAGLYFIEQLHITAKRLKRQATALKIKIPDNFGLSEEMPADSENVQVYLKELDIVDRVTTLLMEEGVQEISLIKPLGLIEHRNQQTEELIFSEIPVQLSFSCSSSSLIKILYQMKNFSPVIGMKDIIVKRAQGLSLQVEMLISRFLIT